MGKGTMKERGGRVHWFIKHSMLITCLVFAVLLSIRGMEGLNRGTGREELLSLMDSGAFFFLDGIWSMSYPAAAEENKMIKTAGTEASQKKTAGENGFGGFLGSIIFGRSPVYRFLEKEESVKVGYQENDPSFSGYLASGKFYKEHQYLLDGGSEESEARTADQAGSTVLASGPGENGTADSAGIDAGDSAAEAVGGTAAGVAGDGSGIDAGDGAGKEAGNGTAVMKDDSMTCAASAIWPIIGTTYRREQLADYDFLMKHFYSVHTATTAGRNLMKADDFLAEDFTLKGDNGKPQILIYHTHSQEAFSDFGPDNKEATVVGIGTYLTKLLGGKGYNVLHDTSVYDLRDGNLDRNKAYTYSLDGVTAILQKNPSLEVLLDIHRDGVNEKLHMVNQVNGKPTAPVMFFNGVSQTPEGPIEYLPNPYRRDNLAFSFQLQLDAAAYFPGLTRKIYIKGLRYNLHLRPRSMLIEVGAQTNTYQEALNAMEPLAEVLNMVLQGN